MNNTKSSKPIKRYYSKDRIILNQEQIYNIKYTPILKDNIKNSSYNKNTLLIDTNNNDFDFNNDNAKIKPLMCKTKKAITIFVIIIFIFIVCIILFSFIFSPISVAKSYIKSCIEKDYKKVYSLLYLTDSPFLTIDNYNAVKSKDFDSKIYNITNIKLKNMERSGTDYIFLLFEFDTQDYTDSALIRLKKTYKKIFRIFTEWKIFSGSEVAYNATVTAPLNYKLNINGTELTDDMIDTRVNYNPSIKKYKIDVFSGKNTVTISTDYMKDRIFEYNFRSESNVNILPIQAN